MPRVRTIWPLELYQLTVDMEKQFLSPSTPLLNWLNSPYAVYASLAACAVFYLATLVDGQNWSGDFSQYVHHAKNLAEGKHYLDTHYLLSSIGVFVGPHAYPPVYPLLLTPLIWIAGMDIELLKWVGNCLFIASIWFTLQCFRPRLQLNLLPLLFIIALNPYLWSFRNNVLSDFTFTFFCFLTLYLFLRYFHQDEAKHFGLAQSVPRAVLLGLCCYLCYGTREIGVVAPLSFLTYDIVCRRRISAASFIIWAVFIGLALLQAHLLAGNFVPQHIHENLNALNNLNNKSSQHDAVNISHLKWISLDPDLILNRIVGYRYAIQDYWLKFAGESGGLLIASRVLFNLTCLLAAAGYLRCLLQKITVLEIFPAGYVAVLLLFGAPPTMRYLIPLFPLFLYFAILGIGLLSLRLPAGWYQRLSLAFCLSTLLIFSWQLPNISYERFEKGVYNPQALELYDFVLNNTSKDATLVFRKPRVLALYTGRLSAPYPTHTFKVDDPLNKYFEAIEGDYYIDVDLGDWMHPLIETAPPTERFTLVFRNNYFAVYQYHSPSTQAPGS